MEKIYRVQMNSKGMPNFSTAVEIADRPQGEWIEVTNGRGGHECSNCHAYAPSYMSGDEHLSDFCPNCGARMKGADDETD